MIMCPKERPREPTGYQMPFLITAPTRVVNMEAFLAFNLY
jgi:hypothetical protein